MIYAALLGLVATCSVFVHGAPWHGNRELHTLFETTSAWLGLLGAAIALTRYYTKRTATYLLLGSGLLGATLLDGYHAAITSSFLAGWTPSALAAITPWSGVTARVFLALLLFLSSLASRNEAQKRMVSKIGERGVYALVGASTLACFFILTFLPLPPALYSHALLNRPADLIPSLFFGLAALMHLRNGAWKTNTFEHWLILSLIAAMSGHLFYMVFSPSLYDAPYFAAHLLKILSFVLLLAGLFSSIFSIFSSEAESVAQLQRANESLGQEVEDRQKAEEALQQVSDGLEDAVEARTAELAEQVHLTSLAADVGIVLTEGGPLPGTLQRCAELVVRHMDAAFARIWTLREQEHMLELQASAGLYTHVDGAHGRIPVGGNLKIGAIAERRQSHTTNAVIGDPTVNNQEWAKREGMVAFAGHPLIVEDRLVGVIGVFARKPLTEAAVQSLASVADEIALGIDHKHAEAALSRLAAIVESSDAAIIGTDLEGIIETWNGAAERMYGYSLEEVKGRPVSILWPPEGGPELTDILRKIKQSEGIAHVESTRVRKDGECIPVLITHSPIRDASGKVVSSCSISVDITERKLLERQLGQAQKLESIGQLAAGIAHEINTPIQYVSDNIRFLRDSFARLEQLFQGYDRLLASLPGDLPSAQVTDIEALAKATRAGYLRTEIPKSIADSLDGVGRVAEIVRAIKEFSHPGPIEKTALDINRAIESTALVSRNEWKYVADLNLDLDPGLPPVRCVPGEFNQVILNLIVNAAHAIADVVSSQSGTKGTITVSTRRVGEWVEIRIRDTGTGIPEEARPSIFNPFFTTKAVGKGTGQGLAIAHTVIVQKHGGSITFETEIGAGTTFQVRLPIGEGPAQAEEDELQPPELALENG
jgi:PAS domain S-box-containing protein